MMNMDKEIEQRNGNDSLSCVLSVWLKQINLLEYSVKLIENGYEVSLSVIHLAEL